MVSRFAFSAAAYLRHEGAVLLVHHKRMDVWLPVGGELEPGESPICAVAREVQEETGIALPDWYAQRDEGYAPSCFIGYEEHDAGSKGTHGTFSFLFDLTAEDRAAVKLCDEHHAHAWVSGWVGEFADQHPMPGNVRRYMNRIFHAPVDWQRLINEHMELKRLTRARDGNPGSRG